MKTINAGLLNIKLKPTVTRVRTRDGKIFEETRGENGFSTKFKGQEALPAFLEEGAQGCSTLAAQVYDLKRKSWIAADDSKHLPGSPAFPAELSFVTYNVWFAQENQQIRAKELLQIVQNCQAQVVCFQEVTEAFLDVVLAQSWVQEDFFLSDSNGLTCLPYGVLLMTHKSLGVLPDFKIHSLPSNMGRRLVTARLSFPDVSSGRTLLIGTIHLESMDNSEMRTEQLKLILPLLQASDIDQGWLLGDFNFSSTACSEAKYLASQSKILNVVDVVKPSTGASDAKAGSLCSLGPNMIDKVVTTIDTTEKDSNHFSPVSMTRLGTASFTTKAAKPVYPSDHVGLHTRFQRQPL